MKAANITHKKPNAKANFRHCRSCYKHLAGVVGVQLTQALATGGYITPLENAYQVTEKGWHWLSGLNITSKDFEKSHRPFTRQCIDGTERKPHLAGHLGDVLLARMLEDNWLERLDDRLRELHLTLKGQEALNDQLGLAIERVASPNNTN